jgi:GcrA cell cycle regulator
MAVHRAPTPEPEAGTSTAAIAQSAKRGKTLLELTNNTCRWPHGRPGTEKFHFCGAPEADLERGIPYCARHMRRAYPMFESALGDRRPAPPQGRSHAR